MMIYKDVDLEQYRTDVLQAGILDENGNVVGERDFVNDVREYLHRSTEKVLVVTGLLGTGKTVGILQALDGLEQDAAYVLIQRDETETDRDYIDFLRNTDKKYIIFDEYTRIRDRDALDRYLLTAVQNGKRIVLTGTEFIELEYFNYGVLNHRVQVLHTSRYALSTEYDSTNFDTICAYIEKALVQNLASFIGNEMDVAIVRQIVYSILFKVIYPEPNQKNMWAVEATIRPRQRDVRRVLDMLEQAGIIRRREVENDDDTDQDQEESDQEVQYELVNPTLARWLTEMVWPDE